MKIIGIVGRVYYNKDNQEIVQINDYLRRILSLYDDVVSILILPTDGVSYIDCGMGRDNINLEKLNFILDKCDGFIVPGGSYWYNFDEYIIRYAFLNNKLVCAICAAPFILGRKGLLKDKNATCFPGFEEELFGANVSKEFVVKDGNIITAKGMGSAIEFGLQIAETLTNPLEVKKIRASLQIYNG